MNDAQKREENLLRLAAKEKQKNLEAMKEVKMARNLCAKEAQERIIAELNALRQTEEKQRVADALFSNDKRYRKYSKDEIELATDLSSGAKLIGEGGCGKVYKCYLHNIPVAIKVLHSDSPHRKQEFLREVFSLPFALDSIHHGSIYSLSYFTG